MTLLTKSLVLYDLCLLATLGLKIELIGIRCIIYKFLFSGRSSRVELLTRRLNCFLQSCLHIMQTTDAHKIFGLPYQVVEYE